MNLIRLQKAVSSKLFFLLETHTDVELAAKLNVSKRTIQNWQRDPSGMTITKIDALEVYFLKINRATESTCES